MFPGPDSVPNDIVARNDIESLVRSRCPYVIPSHVVLAHQIQHCSQI